MNLIFESLVYFAGRSANAAAPDPAKVVGGALTGVSLENKYSKQSPFPLHLSSAKQVRYFLEYWKSQAPWDPSPQVRFHIRVNGHGYFPVSF